METASGIHFIGRVCRDFGVSPRTLRYYEEIGLLAPDREDGQRRYSRADRARLGLILQSRAVGFSLGEIGDLLSLYERQDGAAQHASALSAFRHRLETLEARREALDKVITRLRAAVGQLSEPYEPVSPVADSARQDRPAVALGAATTDLPGGPDPHAR